MTTNANAVSRVLRKAGVNVSPRSPDVQARGDLRQEDSEQIRVVFDLNSQRATDRARADVSEVLVEHGYTVYTGIYSGNLYVTKDAMESLHLLHAGDRPEGCRSGTFSEPAPGRGPWGDLRSALARASSPGLLRDLAEELASAANHWLSVQEEDYL